MNTSAWSAEIPYARRSPPSWRIAQRTDISHLTGANVLRVIDRAQANGYPEMRRGARRGVRATKELGPGNRPMQRRQRVPLTPSQPAEAPTSA